MEIDVEGLAHLLLQKGGSPGELCSGPQAVKWFCHNTVKAFGPGRCGSLHGVLRSLGLLTVVYASMTASFAGNL